MLVRTHNWLLGLSSAPKLAALLLQYLPFDRIQYGSLTVSIGEQQRRFTGTQEGVHAELVIEQPLKFIWLFSSQGELGFAKAYADQLIETPCLYSLLHLGAANQQALSETRLGFNWFYQRFLQRHRDNHNSIENSRDNISAHYDLGNEFYQLWLDDSMSYSSALFTQRDQPMAQAQANKYQRILTELNWQAGDHILEIGCGWGGFAERAAEQGCQVTGITLSSEQLAFALQRLQEQGWAEQVQLQLMDYRHQQGQFDHIVSIEMFEAVGKEYWHDYFTQLKRLLKADGKAVLQVITIEEARAERYQDDVDFIQMFIFPGGLLPSKQQLHELAEAHGFKVSNERAFGQDYARTLEQWQQRFAAQSETLLKLGYDQRFQRIWRYYLDYCRVGFESQSTDVVQLTLEHAQ
ncbi:MAG: cyclopropane-fatty-acyl-phospholipid synthase family protein [Pseudomonas sp.]|jgi:cyclopropane-fatty-acyl-phospholipid synthase|nr:cyclopropane-fatty-acyl-phospholipid synthase family protein [Pseudomonas sp.]NLO54572.1 class I SAM-dependent methyltransferase [Gammaproteobacteria bacterium]